MANLSLSGLGRSALDLLYPPHCALCSARGVFLCQACFAKLPRADGERCDVCWSPLFGASACRACTGHPLALERLRMPFRFEGDVRRLVHAFKFSGQSCLAPSLAAPMLECLLGHQLDADVIVPVPLTGVRQRTRGYNQAALVGREVATGVGLPFHEALRRTRFPGAQAGSASAARRRLNVENAFALREPGVIEGRRVLLVDDITTTGATLDACARVLLAAGADAVLALTFARED